MAGVTSRGLYAQFVLDACGIITGNRWDGWLSTSKDAALAVVATIQPTSILQGSSYYFHLPPLSNDSVDGCANAPYPVIPTFREWRFPHDQLPESWNRLVVTNLDPAVPAQSFSISNLATALQTRDATCRMSRCREGAQVAHICPQKEADWWYKNAMSTYNVGSANTLDDLSNALLLRADLHIAFDKPKFVFYPKQSSDLESPRLITHLLEASAELEHLYHNCELQSTPSSIQTYFARFAWAIFPLLDAFLTCRERHCLLVREIAEDWVDGDGFFPWEICAQYSGKRSRSPKKRRLDDGSAPNNGAGVAVDAKEELRPWKRRYPNTGDRSKWDLQDSDSIHSDARGRKRYRQCAAAIRRLLHGQENDSTTLQSRSGKPYHERPESRLRTSQDTHGPDPLANSHSLSLASPAISRAASQSALQSLSEHSNSLHDPSLSHIAQFPAPDPSLGNNATAILTKADTTSQLRCSSLAHTWLAAERLRSDPHGQWKDEQAWAEDVWKGNITLDEKSARNWLELCGAEFQEVTGTQWVGGEHDVSRTGSMKEKTGK